ncbi:hypothetical protein [Paludibaculum fermentans]|uniref:hypothetical protein n=1 Tax=Paludibaculum fermentans TaxID=1473598 RepID=UPI003EB859FD
MTRLFITALLLAALVTGQSVPPGQARRSFVVKQVVPGMVYLDGGSAHGLAEGMTLKLERRAPGDARLATQRIADVLVVSVATQSALAEVRNAEKDVQSQVGDEALLSGKDAEAFERLEAASRRQRYAQVISFSSGDPLEEEVREHVPMAQPKEVGRLRGRIGFEMNVLNDRSAGGLSSHQEGISARVDWTRIDGTYWNLTGYWRGRWNTRQSGTQQQTMIDLINRTYTIGMFYNNPRSKYIFGFGRVLIPWASSLSTIDGGYAARRITPHVTVGVFGGSTPDPTQWNYDPKRQMLGLFTSFEEGTYEKVRWTGTVGAALTRVRWKPERQFLFVENSIFAGTKFSVMHSMEADQKNPRYMNGETGPMLSRSFLTFRYHPSNRLSFDVNQNYFRGLPTFDMTLIGTGLLDKYLFQGFSGGFRAQPIDRLVLSANWGRSKRDTDTTASLNQMYSLGWTRLPWIGVRVDGRYTRFNSTFGNGSYESISLMRQIRDDIRLELQVGQQNFAGPLTQQTRSRFINGQADWSLGQNYFLTGGWLSYRGGVQNYDQIFFTLGYRF